MISSESSMQPSPIYSDPQNINTLDDVCRWLCDDDDHQETEEIQSVVTVGDVMKESESESQMGLQNLLEAYADGISMGQIELSKVIVRCINEKTNPSGQILERLAFNLFQNQAEEYLKEESMRNLKMAFRVFYDIFPYGRFAHFTANSIIIESIPTHVESVHIVDFHLGEGCQWPPLIEAVARMNKSLIITSIKLDQDQDSQFDQTKMNLCNFAKSLGLHLKIQEMGMAQMMTEINQRNLGSEFNQFLAFNCMIGLPHMGITRTTTQVMDFLKLATRVLANKKGIITVGDGEEGARTGNYSDFSSFFNKTLAHYKALYESIEWGFPSCLNEGRMAMETLFVSPFIKSESWFQKWDEGRENMGLWQNLGLKGVKMSMDRWIEGRELVKAGESPYGIGIGIGRGNGNEMVLEWRGVPVVRVFAWVVIQQDICD
ncbi:hypothetical protein SSX86_010376 [Deinandra increscens subsp. villosa]|uniref:Nodulation signaling pathway 2-like protein n=1 Tax=Deinandra increscens subsp. villosa TaxID=3103831 RepID=A0AAP0DBN1_9ASTR